MDLESAHLIGEDRTPTTTGPLIGSISASESPNEEAEMTLMGGLVGLLCCFRNVRNRITVISDPQYARCTPMLPGTPETIVTLFLELSHAHQRDAFHYRSIQAIRPEQVLRALRAYTRTITQETIGTSLRHYFRQQLFFWPLLQPHARLWSWLSLWRAIQCIDKAALHICVQLTHPFPGSFVVTIRCDQYGNEWSRVLVGDSPPLTGLALSSTSLSHAWNHCSLRVQGLRSC